MWNLATFRVCHTSVHFSATAIWLPPHMTQKLLCQTYQCFLCFISLNFFWALVYWAFPPPWHLLFPWLLWGHFLLISLFCFLHTHSKFQHSWGAGLRFLLFLRISLPSYFIQAFGFKGHLLLILSLHPSSLCSDLYAQFPSGHPHSNGSQAPQT